MSDEMTAPGRLVLGSAQWGQPYGIANRLGPPSEDELRRILDIAAGAGVFTIDTAPAYGPSESLIGRLTADEPRWQVVTKLAPDVTASGRSAEDVVSAAVRSLDASRHALRRDRLDTVLLHRAAHRVTHGGAIWQVLIERREHGAIGHIGVSANSPQEAFELLDDPNVDVIQVATSLLDQRLLRAGFFARAGRQPVHVFVRSIYLQGVAHMRSAELPSHLSGLAPVIASIRDWADEQRQAPAVPYVHFARMLPASVVIGVERTEQLLDALQTWAEPATSADALQSLAAAIPDLEPELLTPSLWAQLALRSRADRR